MPNMKLGDTALIVAECKSRGLPRNHCANVLAQSYWESGRTMKPIREMGGEKYLRAKPYHPHVGMGYVQLTWEENYRDWSNRIGVDFVKNPTLLLKPEYAARILVEGMKLGTFTGKNLADFLSGGKSDHFNARAIVNGDKNKVPKGETRKIGTIIADLAEEYDLALRIAGYDAQPAPSAPAPAPKPVLVPPASKPVPEPAPVPPKVSFWDALVAILKAFVKGGQK